MIMFNDAPSLRRGRLFIVALLALFTAGAAVSMRAATAVHMRSEYLDPIDKLNAGEMLGTVTPEPATSSKVNARVAMHFVRRICAIPFPVN